MSTDSIIRINFKHEEAFSTLISKFRTLLDHLNTVFIDLVIYNEELKPKCLEISKINNQYIRKFILPDDESSKLLTHQNSIVIIENYLCKDKSKAPSLIEEINEEIKIIFNTFLESSESPYKLECNSSSNFEKKLDKLKNSIETKLDLIDDYFDDISIFFNKNSNKGFEDDDEDDNDDDSSPRNDSRYFGDPYPKIPKAAYKSISQFMSYINSQIVIRNILDFDNKINECYEKLKLTRPPPPGNIDQKIIDNLMDQIKELEQKNNFLEEKNYELVKQNRQSENKIKKLEDQISEKDKTIADLQRIIDDQKGQTQKFTPKPGQIINLKDDEKYLDAVSYFRSTINSMNNGFIDLASYKKLTNNNKDFVRYAKLINNNYYCPDKCKEVCLVNNNFIKDLVSNNSELTHHSALINTFKYFILESKENDKVNICITLLDLKKKFESWLNNYKPFENLPPKTSKEQKKKLEQCIEKLKESVLNKPNISNSQYTDFMEDKIKPIYLYKNKNAFNDDNDDFDDDDDDDDEDKLIDQRYYGNPYPSIPKEVQLEVNIFLAYVNSFISISSLLDFSTYVNSRLSKVTDEKMKNPILLYSDFLDHILNMYSKKFDDDAGNQLTNCTSGLLRVANELYSFVSKSKENFQLKTNKLE